VANGIPVSGDGSSFCKPSPRQTQLGRSGCGPLARQAPTVPLRLRNMSPGTCLRLYGRADWPDGVQVSLWVWWRARQLQQGPLEVGRVWPIHTFAARCRGIAYCQGMEAGRHSTHPDVGREHRLFSRPVLAVRGQGLVSSCRLQRHWPALISAAGRRQLSGGDEASWACLMRFLITTRTCLIGRTPPGVAVYRQAVFGILLHDSQQQRVLSDGCHALWKKPERLTTGGGLDGPAP